MILRLKKIFFQSVCVQVCKGSDAKVGLFLTAGAKEKKQLKKKIQKAARATEKKHIDKIKASGKKHVCTLQKKTKVLHCNAKGSALKNILAKKKEALQIVLTSRLNFLKKEKSFEKF